MLVLLVDDVLTAAEALNKLSLQSAPKETALYPLGIIAP